MRKSEGAPDRRAGNAVMAEDHGADVLSLVAAASDLAIVTSLDGHIEDVVWHIEGVNGFNPALLQGVPLEDTVTEECRPKIRQMLSAPDGGKAPRWREINHLIEGLGELPVRYQAIHSDGRVIFVGRELRAVSMLQTQLVEAQRALDEDYSRLRQLQTRYRVLFQTSSEPLLIADGRTHKIQEANTAAYRMLGIDASDLVGQSFPSIFTPTDRGGVMEVLGRVVSGGQAETVSGTLRETEQPFECKITVFRAADQMMLLCRPSQSSSAREGAKEIEQMLVGVVDRIPDAVVLADTSGGILWCNDAFLGMAETALAAQLRGSPLAQFLSRPGVDIDIIIDNAREHGSLRAFSSSMVGAYGSETPVEISVAAVPETDPSVIGFVMRDISRYDQVPSRKSGGSTESVDHMMNLVGTVPLKDLVRASTEEIEKMCIEAALQKTGNNRASAAEMLGLSRQSLYVKLRRFGLLNSRIGE